METSNGGLKNVFCKIRSESKVNLPIPSCLKGTSKMSGALLFSDGSVNTKSGIGYGAYLLVKNLDTTSLEASKNSMQIKRFNSTSSTKLELEALLWALEKVMPQLSRFNSELTIYTDSQNIVGLPNRRGGLEQNNYYSRNNKRLTSYLLYKKFYQLSDQLNFELVKVQGHKALSQKNEIDQYFALVDQAARRAMRESQVLSA